MKVSIAPKRDEVTGAEAINRMHREICSHGARMVNIAILIGAELIRIKEEECEHGEWGDFVLENLDFSVRTASNYMRISRSRAEIERANVTVLTRAYALLTKSIAHKPIFDATDETKSETVADLDPGHTYKSETVADLTEQPCIDPSQTPSGEQAIETPVQAAGITTVIGPDGETEVDILPPVRGLAQPTEKPTPSIVIAKRIADLVRCLHIDETYPRAIQVIQESLEKIKKELGDPIGLNKGLARVVGGPA
jgi:hypothetical protein